MARQYTRKNTAIEDSIKIQEDAVTKAKEKYDREVEKLKDLYTKRDEQKEKELLKTVEKSDKTFEEIMAFLGGE